jgi:hypothetical protein
MAGWHLVDCAESLGVRRKLPRVQITSEVQLRGQLGRFKERYPAIVILEGPAKRVLEISIGGPFGSVHSPWPPGSEFIVRPFSDPPVADDMVFFAWEGQDTGVGPRSLLPADEVIEAAVHFFLHKRLPESVLWERWNPALHRWERVHPRFV